MKTKIADGKQTKNDTDHLKRVIFSTFLEIKHIENYIFVGY